ncbi:Fur family transcriptional regulator [Marinifilum caeruleilacunae]|uniref:Transcriptional repressor n=1 Tax=Marinifilum caeruleilacunae TaxID=2499076 RepID=A0ABX1X0L4_9BACT|nr:transcriptional repressor [Marinifilum caeruleilacunae]NOU61950.1 transcriptional repressor [Marinifilum caeruleilacunae]
MKPAEILNTHKLKRTSCREGILEVVINAGQPLSENEIRENLPGNYDRTTFYRSFKTLEEHQIIHKIVIDNQLVKYALHNSITHKQDHAHFYCNDCDMVKCLDDIPVQKYQLPDGFSDNETEVIIKGTCPKCKNKD